jgi:GrpB-like predicted nucleotidyltransferase (UPF0157 family)
LVIHNKTDQWQKQASQECDRLLAALGELTQGGIVEKIEHIGATSIPGLPARPCIDLALAIYPFPLPPDARATLDALGYHAASTQPSGLEQLFIHTTSNFQLFISELGSDSWVNHLLIRDYLRHVKEARQHYAAQKPSWLPASSALGDNSEAKATFFTGLLAVAKPWWISYHGWGAVDYVVQELEGYGQPWYISSGWALDLFLGRVTRIHHDVDVVVDRTNQLQLREHLTARGWNFFTPLRGKLEPWPAHMRLELPRHQIHAHREEAFIDFLLTDLSHGIWRYRRDPRVIRTLEQAVRHKPQGIPHLAPELVLLFKSKNTSGADRSKDQVDFELVHPQLEPEARAWLRWALLATDPTHPWIDRLV